jgi:26S proteasome regulatory subunit N4
MAIIEKAIHEHFAYQARLSPAPAASGGEGPVENRPLVSRPVAPLDIPFAKVNSVILGSPADDAGLKAGDEIRNFGYVNQSNHDGLKRVAECVQGNEGVGSPSVC